MRLPPKKSKQKQIVIDYTSIASAKASAPESYDYESWLQEGIKQEEQGERYQFGSKATRHYSNAVISYSIAASLSPTDFDSRYNAARVHYQLATDHLSPNEAFDALGKAIMGYRDAVAVLEEGGETIMARIDGLFNLAQADVGLFEMLDEAAVVGAPEGTALQAAKEAKELFVQVEALQRVEMEKIFGSGGSQESAQESEETQEEPAGEVEATQTTIVTPQLVLDTLLESISVDMSLHESLSRDPASQAQLLESAKATFERAVSLRNNFLSDAPEVDVEMTLAQFSIYSAPSSPEATQLLDGALAGSSNPSPSLLSICADHLVESVPLSQPLEVVGPQLERALSTYQRVQALLTNRLSPPKDVPSYQIPLLLSSNLLAQSTVHLLSYHLTQSSNNPSSSLQHLTTAHTLALESITVLKSGLALKPSSTSSGLALLRSPPSQEPLSNLSTVLAVRSSYFALIRIRIRSADSDEKLQEERKRFWSVWSALTRAERDAPELRKADMGWWIGEIEEDKVAECIGAEQASKETQWWTSLLA